MWFLIVLAVLISRIIYCQLCLMVNNTNSNHGHSYSIPSDTAFLILSGIICDTWWCRSHNWPAYSVNEANTVTGHHITIAFIGVSCTTGRWLHCHYEHRLNSNLSLILYCHYQRSYRVINIWKRIWMRARLSFESFNDPFTHTCPHAIPRYIHINYILY